MVRSEAVHWVPSGDDRDVKSKKRQILAQFNNVSACFQGQYPPQWSYPSFVILTPLMHIITKKFHIKIWIIPSLQIWFLKCVPPFFIEPITKVDTWKGRCFFSSMKPSCWSSRRRVDGMNDMKGMVKRFKSMFHSSNIFNYFQFHVHNLTENVSAACVFSWYLHSFTICSFFFFFSLLYYIIPH